MRNAQSGAFFFWQTHILSFRSCVVGGGSSSSSYLNALLGVFCALLTGIYFTANFQDVDSKPL